MKCEDADYGQCGKNMGVRLLLYDGECVLCTMLVEWLMRISVQRSRHLRVVPLQGRVGVWILQRTKLVNGGSTQFDSLVFFPTWRCKCDAPYYLRTDGVVAIFSALGGPWSIAARVLHFIPRRWRDVVYRWVARMRRHLYGHAGR